MTLCAQSMKKHVTTTFQETTKIQFTNQSEVQMAQLRTYIECVVVSDVCVDLKEVSCDHGKRRVRR